MPSHLEPNDSFQQATRPAAVPCESEDSDDNQPLLSRCFPSQSHVRKNPNVSSSDSDDSSDKTSETCRIELQNRATVARAGDIVEVYWDDNEYKG